MSFSSNMITISKKLIAKYGELVTFVRHTEGGFNTSTGDAPDSATVTYSSYGFPYPYKPNEINNTTVLVTDIRLLIPINSTTAPQIGDIVVFRNLDYRIEGPISIYSAQGQDVAYEVTLRG